MPLYPKDPDQYESDWRAMRKQSLGALLEAKLRPDTSDYNRTLVDMELDRRTYVRDRQFDRRVTLIALVLSVAAVIVSVWRAANESERSPTAAARASPPAVASPSPATYLEP